MARAVFSVLLLIVLVVYGAMFLTWNQQPVSLTGLAFGQQWWIEDNIPLGYVALGGVLAGALLMGLFVAGPYAGQRSAARQAQAKVQIAKTKLNELVAKIKQQRSHIEDLEKQLAGPRSSAPAATPLAAESASAAEESLALDETDDELI